MSEQQSEQWVLSVTAEATVERHPECPVCGQVGCEIVHTATEETQ